MTQTAETSLTSSCATEPKTAAPCRPASECAVESTKALEDRSAAWLWLIWSGRRLIFRVSVLAGTAALLLGLLTPNRYRSTTRLMPPENRSMSGLATMVEQAGRSGEMGLLGSSVMGTQSAGALFVGMLHSQTARENLVDQFDLTRAYARLGWRLQKEDACRELENNTETSEDRKSGIITISVTDRDRQRAAALANAYADQLNRMIARLNTSAARREREFLELRLVEMRKSLEQADHNLAQFSSQSATLDPKEQGAAMVEAAATLQGQLIAAQSELRGLQEIYSNGSVRVLSLQARIAELKKQLATLSGAKRHSRGLGDTGDLPFPSMRQIPVLSETFVELARQAKIEEAMYQFLAQQYEIARVQEAKEIPTVRILDMANPPLRKSGPHRFLLVLVGSSAGAFFACVWLMGVSKWQAVEPGSAYKSLVSDVSSAAQQARIYRVSAAVRAHLRNWNDRRRSTPE